MLVNVVLGGSQFFRAAQATLYGRDDLGGAGKTRVGPYQDPFDLSLVLSLTLSGPCPLKIHASQLASQPPVIVFTIAHQVRTGLNGSRVPCASRKTHGIAFDSTYRGPDPGLVGAHRIAITSPEVRMGPSIIAILIQRLN